MRGQKVSIRSSISEELRNSESRLFDRPSDEELYEQEEKARFDLNERNKRKPYEEDQARFRASRGNRKPFSLADFEPKNRKRNKGKERDLGIPVGEYLYFVGGKDGLPSLFDRPPTPRECKKEEYKITRTKGKSHRFEKTLCSHIFRLLYKRGESLHINEIIIALQKANILTSVTLHTYSVVYRTITRNLALFERTDKATFSLRPGFIPATKVEKMDRPAIHDDEFSSLQDLVIEAYRQLPTDDGACPSDVYQLLKTLGFNGPYKTIYEAMQSSNFTRANFSYFLVADEQA